MDYMNPGLSSLRQEFLNFNENMQVLLQTKYNGKVFELTLFPTRILDPKQPIEEFAVGKRIITFEKNGSGLKGVDQSTVITIDLGLWQDTERRPYSIYPDTRQMMICFWLPTEKQWVGWGLTYRPKGGKKIISGYDGFVWQLDKEYARRILHAYKTPKLKPTSIIDVLHTPPEQLERLTC